nr:MAG TPA: hypothetical protein [Caudoviricetes sp.]
MGANTKHTLRCLFDGSSVVFTTTSMISLQHAFMHVIN